ncbi:MAG TPA: PASTA domain-containing protein [Vicinamibacterales bacterium]|nr:PASTA domain-containing protein [Vicinamibacterales bacterium]
MRALHAAAVLAGLLAFSEPPEASQPAADTGPPPIAQIDKIVVGGAPKLEPAAAEVRVIRAQQLVPARPAMQLFEHDEILTGPDVTVTILCLEEVAEEDKTVFVGAASQIRLRSQRSIFLILGRILANVRGRFDVGTARATLGSRSTEFEVRVGEDGATQLLVLEGVVDVQRSEEAPAVERQPVGRLFGPVLVRTAFSAQKLPQPAAVGRLEEVTIQKGDPTTRVNDTTEDRVRGALTWTTDAAIAGQPPTAPKRVIPHFESAEARARAFRQAKFDAIWKRQPGSNETLGKVYSDWEQGAKAVEVFAREVGVNPAQQKSGNFQASVGEALRMKGRLKEAEEQLLKAASLDPGSARALNGLGNVYFAQAAAAEDGGGLDAAAGLLQKCLKIYADSRQARLDMPGTPSGIGWANDGEAKLALGDIARQQNRLEDAAARYKEGRDAFVRASGADPHYVFAAVGVADSARRIGSVARRRGAEAEAKQAFREAESEYRKIVETHPTLSAAHLGLGDLYLETGARKEAIASYTRALVLRPDQPAPHLRLGIALAEENPRAAALQAKTYLAIEQRPLKEGRRMSVATDIATGNPSRATPDKPEPEIPPGPPRAVPKVEGMLQEQAAARLREHGFRVGKIDRKESSQNPGTVLDQEPEGGKKAAGGTAVALEVAIPKGTTVEVPDVVGDSRDRAIQKLRDKGLVAQPITERASCDEAGKVVAQEPDEDARVSKGTSVALVVATAGPEAVRVPRLVGSRLADVDRAARERPFKIGRVERRPTDQQPPDTIISQSPKADTPVAPGCPVDVVVASEIQRVTVPDFRGITEGDARRRLTAVGLRLGSVEPRQARGTPGTVIAQSPEPNSLVEVGTRVDLAVVAQRQTPPPPPPPDDLVNVPDLKGSMRQSAEATLRGLGMNVKTTYQVITPSVRSTRVQPKHDQVLSQSHAGPVKRGTTIQLTVARVQQPIGE